MYLSRRAFLKRAPRSRASRILNELASRPSVSVRSSQSVQHVLQAILDNMNNSSKTVESRMKELVELIGQLPPWKEWTAQVDTVVASAMQNFRDMQQESKSSDDKDEKDDLPQGPDDRSEKIIDAMLVDTLIEMNGNVAAFTREDMERFDRRDKFWMVFNQWLRCVSSPIDPQCHIKDETGAWITDEQLRHRLSHGDVLHFLSRTIRPAAWSHFSRALVPVSEKRSTKKPQTAEQETSPLLLDAP